MGGDTDLLRPEFCISCCYSDRNRSLPLSLARCRPSTRNVRDISDRSDTYASQWASATVDDTAHMAYRLRVTGHHSSQGRRKQRGVRGGEISDKCSHSATAGPTERNRSSQQRSTIARFDQPQCHRPLRCSTELAPKPVAKDSISVKPACVTFGSKLERKTPQKGYTHKGIYQQTIQTFKAPPIQTFSHPFYKVQHLHPAPLTQVVSSMNCCMMASARQAFPLAIPLTFRPSNVLTLDMAVYVCPYSHASLISISA